MYLKLKLPGEEGNSQLVCIKAGDIIKDLIFKMARFWMFPYFSIFYTDEVYLTPDNSCVQRDYLCVPKKLKKFRIFKSFQDKNHYLCPSATTLPLITSRQIIQVF